MIIVHDIFVCKPGNASKMAKMFKETMPMTKMGPYIMTDMTGQYNRVIMAMNFENLTDYEKHMEAYKNPSPEMKEQMSKMKDYHEMYLTGSREIFPIW